MAHTYRPAPVHPFDRVPVWTDADGTTRPSQGITTLSGQSITGSVLVADASGRLPEFMCADAPVYVGQPGATTALTPIDDVSVDEATPVVVYGVPADGKVPVWNGTLKRFEWGDAGGSGGTSPVGFGDNMALYGNAVAVASSVAMVLPIVNNEFPATGTTFTRDSDGLITVNNDCVVAVDVMVDFADAGDTTARNVWIQFNGGSLTTEGGTKNIPAVSGANTQLDAHNTVPVPAGTTIGVRVRQGSGSDMFVTAEIEVTCLGHTS